MELAVDMRHITMRFPRVVANFLDNFILPAHGQVSVALFRRFFVELKSDIFLRIAERLCIGIFIILPGRVDI